MRVTADRRPRSLVRAGAIGAIAALSATVLAACSSGGSSSGTPTINWYINPNSSGSNQQVVNMCVKQAKGAYKVNIQVLPATADGQREQLVRRLAAGDSSIDVMNVDPPYAPELANAGWLRPFSDSEKTEVLQNILQAPIASGMWHGKLFSVPWNANTQLLWYKKSVAQKAGVDPTAANFTWDEMINAALKTNTRVIEQGFKYEGYMVWVNAMVLGAGGQILEHNELGRNATVAINSPQGREGAAVIQKLANSKAASPSLSTSMEEQGRAAFVLPDGGFFLNWPYTYAAWQADVKAGALDQKVLDDIAWARYPRVNADLPSKPPLGGNNLAISKFSKHPDQDLAFVKCAISPAAETIVLTVNGDPAANALVYDEPEVLKLLPMAPLMKESIDAAGPRPVTPFYGDVSASIQRTWYPPSGVRATTTPKKSEVLITDVLHDRVLL